jgi:hypothetical protein
MFRSTSAAYANVAAPSVIVEAAADRITERERMPPRVVSRSMTTFKDRLETDLRTAIKARDELVVSTLRMAIAAVRNEEVAGTEARTLTDDEVRTVLGREVKKRRDAAAAFADAGRAEQAERERSEERVLEGYLPAQMSADDLAAAVAKALDGLDLSGRQAMGAAMKAAQAEVAGRAEGGRVAAEVRRQLGL